MGEDLNPAVQAIYESMGIDDSELTLSGKKKSKNNNVNKTLTIGKKNFEVLTFYDTISASHLKLTLFKIIQRRHNSKSAYTIQLGDGTLIQSLRLDNVSSICLAHNELTEFPVLCSFDGDIEIDYMTRTLKDLQLQYNKIHSFPNLQMLTSLSSLNLQHNVLSGIQVLSLLECNM